MNNEIILDTDDIAAKHMTGLQGWVSRHGRFFGNGPRSEVDARYDGCTHRACTHCGASIKKTYTMCDVCRQKAAAERYAKRKRKPWDGTAMLYSDAHDQWFNDMDEVNDYCDEHGVDQETLQLLIGEPVYASLIDPAEHYTDDLPDEDAGYIPTEIQEAFRALNEAIASCNTPISWRAGEYALDTESPAQAAGGGE